MATPVDVTAPMSYTGSARRIRHYLHPLLVWVPLGLPLTLLAWAVVTCWYLVFGLLLAPYRMVRRGGRRRKIEAARHREIVEARRN